MNVVASGATSGREKEECCFLIERSGGGNRFSLKGVGARPHAGKGRIKGDTERRCTGDGGEEEPRG